MATYGYCRVSTKTQKIDRQVKNISQAYPDAILFQEAYTGTKIVGRKEFNRLLKIVKPGDTIVFDSVSRMSRNADEGTAQYFDLYGKGVNLVFLKEPYINTSTYDEQQADKIDLLGTDEDILLDAINRYLRRLAEKQIRIAFDQAQKEVDDLHVRTSEGIRAARDKGRVIGGAAHKSKTLNIKGKEEKKAEIKKKSKSFGGSMTDKDLIKVIGIANNTYYKYKREVAEELQAEQNRA
ncbi:MAG: recombinase family protein [Clostridiales bacterium]|nr:recombinase family protein [Clostridiales bacterium]